MQMMVKGWFSRVNGYRLAVFLLVAAAAFVFFAWKLSSLTPGISMPEAEQIAHSRSWHAVADNPSFVPHSLVQSALLHGGLNNVFWVRVVSVLFAVLFIWSFYRLAFHWFGRTVALFSTLIFASTPLVIVSARNATPDILFLFDIALLNLYYWLLRTAGNSKLPWLALLAASAASLYIPDGLIFVLAAVILARKRLLAVVKALDSKFVALSFVLFLVLIAPLGWAIFKNPDLVKSLLPIPHSWGNITGIVKSLAWGPLELVWRAREHNIAIIGRLPVLNVVQVVLFVFGIWAMFARARKQLYILLAAAIGGVLLAGINNNFSLLLAALGPISLIAAAGLRYLLLEWREIFPRNPLPKALALFMVAAAVAASVAYGLRYSLVAWPHVIETKNSYMIKY